MRRLFDDLFTAFGFLTRIPLPQPETESGRSLSRCVWAFPVVGAVLGALAALVFFAAQFAGLGVALSAGLAVGAQLLLTGALHEDGLADFADGMGGGRNRETVLAIMRDSRIGAFGVIALVMAIGLRWSAIANLGLHMVLAGLICSALIGRLVMALLPRFLEPARHDGLGILVARPPVGALLAGFTIALAVLLLHLPAIAVAIAIAVAGLSAGWIGALARRRAGGYTGDVLGTAGLVAETAALLVFAAL